MATGIYAGADLAANTSTDLYTTVTTGVYNISFCNKSSIAATIRLAISASGTPAAGEHRFYELLLEGNGFKQYTGTPIQVGKHIVVQASTANVAVAIEGVE